MGWLKKYKPAEQRARHELSRLNDACDKLCKQISRPVLTAHSYRSVGRCLFPASLTMTSAGSGEGIVCTFDVYNIHKLCLHNSSPTTPVLTAAYCEGLKPWDTHNCLNPSRIISAPGNSVAMARGLQGGLEQVPLPLDMHPVWALIDPASQQPHPQGAKLNQTPSRDEYTCSRLYWSRMLNFW